MSTSSSPETPNSGSPISPPPSSEMPPSEISGDASAAKSKGPLIITLLVVALLILHQDNWFWDDGTLVMGFIPIALFWHACISIGASATWFLATRIAWPIDDTVVKQLASSTAASDSADSKEAN